MEPLELLMLYSHSDTDRVKKLAQKLTEQGIRVRYPEDELTAGSYWEESINAAIAGAKFVVIFLSRKSLASQYLMLEMAYACQCAQKRDKQILLVEEASDLLAGFPSLQIQLRVYPSLIPRDGLDSEWSCEELARRIHEALCDFQKKELLYEKISNLLAIQYGPGVCVHLTELIGLLCQEVEQENDRPYERRNRYKELLRCTELLARNGESGYTDQDRAQAKTRMDTAAQIDRILQHDDFMCADLFLIAAQLRLLYLIREIRLDCIDTLTHGDVHSDQVFDAQYRISSDFHGKRYQDRMAAEGISETNPGGYPEDELPVILQVKEYLHVSKEREKRQVPAAAAPSEEEQKLNTIAKNMRYNNRLFESLGEDQPAVEYLKCVKTSYERLKMYAEVVGCKQICAECIERIAEINQKLEMTGSEKSGNVRIESGIKALLGFSLPGSDRFDVFLSYKHEDADIARNVYHFLKSNLIHPFFDSVTLPELSKSEYEEAIMTALDRSRHFVVVLSSLKYLDAPWVSLEMKTFRHEMVEGRKKNANFLMVVTEDVFAEIRATNKECLPIQYRSCEIMGLEDYRRSLMQYLR